MIKRPSERAFFNTSPSTFFSAIFLNPYYAM
jgi:hypothetical protein